MYSNFNRIKPSKPKIPLLFRFVRWIYPKLEQYTPSLAEALATGLFLRPLRTSIQPVAIELEKSAHQYKLTFGDKCVHAYKWGEGPYILFSHGWSSRAMQFHTIIKALLADGFSVIAFDHYGHGKSGGHTSNVILFSNAIAAFTEEEKIIGIVGHSLGAAGALLTVKKKVLKLKTVIIAPPVTRRAIIDTFMAKIKAKKDLLPIMDKYCLKHFGAPFEKFTAESFAEEIRPFPLLIIHDKKDRESPLSESEYLAEKMPFAKIVITEKLGHNRILHEAEVTRLISDFMSESLS